MDRPRRPREPPQLAKTQKVVFDTARFVLYLYISRGLDNAGARAARNGRRV